MTDQVRQPERRFVTTESVLTALANGIGELPLNWKSTNPLMNLIQRGFTELPEPQPEAKVENKLKVVPAESTENQVNQKAPE